MKHPSTATALLAAVLMPAGTQAFFGGKPPERPSGPREQLGGDLFPWRNPFSTAAEADFTPTCTATKTYAASEYLLDDLQFPPQEGGIGPYAIELKKILAGRPYPGSWNGIDPHGYDRNLLQMRYTDVPLGVREWIEEQQRSDGAGNGLFAVFGPLPPGEPTGEEKADPVEPPAAAGSPRVGDEEKSVLFAPGALYTILPLWTAEGSDCKADLDDLSKYSTKPEDGRVSAWVTKYSKADRDDIKRDITFTVTAKVLKGNAKKEANKDEL